MQSAVKEYRWEDLEIGLGHHFQAKVTEAMMNRFQVDSGDCNPLHIDASFAREQGFKDRVVYGLLTSSFYSTLVGVYLPGKFCLLHGIDVSFVNPVFVDEALTISGSITHLSDAYRQATIVAQIVNDSGVTVSKAKIRVGLRLIVGAQS